MTRITKVATIFKLTAKLQKNLKNNLLFGVGDLQFQQMRITINKEWRLELPKQY